MKTNNKHTKGPWKVMGESTLSIISYHIPKGRKICSLLNQSTEDYKNAALIAAAPEMFEVLQLIGTIANVGLETDGDYKNRMKRISEHATEILKKARGE